jgi:hypothetical protein
LFFRVHGIGGEEVAQAEHPAPFGPQERGRARIGRITGTDYRATIIDVVREAIGSQRAKVD